MTTARGFTLIEMAIVLVIVTILIGGLAMPLSAQIQARRIAETRADMDGIRGALIGYAMSHTKACTCSYDTSGLLASTNPNSGCAQICPATSNPSDQLTFTRHYFPCPDNSSPATGVEALRSSTGACPAARGTLPWRTLGVKGHDVWGNRYTYAVTLDFANDQRGFVSTPAATTSDLSVFPDADCDTASVAENVPVVVASHGPNGRGAQNMNGGTPLAAAALPDDEAQNLITPAAVAPCDSTSFVSRTPSDTFDDLIVWLSPGEFFNRVCPTGGCL